MLRGFDRPRAAPQRPAPREEPSEEAPKPARKRPGPATPPRPRRPRVPAPTQPVRGQKIPYLNVITNFSKPNPAPTTAQTSSSHRRDPSLQDRRRKGRVNGSSRRRAGNAKGDESEWGLSPSDRELMIGISIPGPPDGRPDEPTKDDKLGGHSPQPAIVITPAEEQPPVLKQRTRATSSIYSRVPSFHVTPDSAPPVPRIPRQSVATSIDTSSRCTSWATDFSEDDTLQHSRPESRESQQPMVNRRSTDTVATKYRSRGWWNQILSPFLERPELPKEIALDRDGDESPDDPRTGNWKVENNVEKHPNRVDSIWADLTGHYTLKEDRFFPEAKDPSFNDYPGVHRGAVVESPAALEETGHRAKASPSNGLPFPGDRSPEILGTMSMGLAAEYYTAYWHDQNNPTSYFKCENHVCAYGRGMLDPAGEGGARNDGSRGIEEGGDTSENTLERGVPTEEAAATKQVKDRPLSEATVIEEEPSRQPVERSRGSPAKGIEDSRIRPLPLAPADPVSPEAMTPGLRTAYIQDRAVPLRSNPTKLPPGDEPAPRYPAMGGFNGGPRKAPTPPPAPAFSSPTPLERGRFGADSAATPPERSGFGSQQATHVHQYFGTDAERGGPREINDPHTWKFPPPPAEAATKRPKGKENKAKENGKKPGLLKRIFGKAKTKEAKKRRKLFCCIFIGLFLMVILIVVLVIELTLPRNDMSSQISWLNITGFPPAPTGISTIIRPNVQSVNGCIAPPTMWSCALPKELQSTISPNPPDQPNFRIEIRFQNGTNFTSNAGNSKRSTAFSSASLVQGFQRRLLQTRDSFTNGLFTPSPAPPSTEDQNFLGNTTDHNHAPFGGEATPFYMSILNADPVSNPARRLIRRQSSSSGNGTNSTDPFPNLGNDIPAPAINSDGTAAAANLYPFPTAQPLMLYDRGLETEHYGFYSYFDRSIFLKSASVANLSTIGVVPDDENGGSTEDEASLRCTWAQTRFLVQIWTNAQGNLPLLSNGTKGDSSSGNNSANDFTPPGSFPYPVSITMDRHGGDINSKSVYCYGVDDREQIITSEKQFQIENRGFDGHLVNPALGLFSHINVSVADGGPGGIDGGSGGCSCLWRNFNTS